MVYNNNLILNSSAIILYLRTQTSKDIIIIISKWRYDRYTINVTLISAINQSVSINIIRLSVRQAVIIAISPLLLCSNSQNKRIKNRRKSSGLPKLDCLSRQSSFFSRAKSSRACIRICGEGFSARASTRKPGNANIAPPTHTRIRSHEQPLRLRRLRETLTRPRELLDTYRTRV